MSLPTTVDPASPPNSESPRLGAQRMREIKQLLIDLGLPASPTTITSPIFNVDGSTPTKFTNSSGGASVLGDVETFPTGAAKAYLHGDTVRSLQPYIAVNAAISSAADGPVITAGAASVLAQGTVTSGNYIRKSATTKAIEDTSIAANATNPIPFGAIGIALTTGTNAVISAYLFGMTRNPLIGAGDAVSGNWIAGASGLLYSDATQAGTPASTVETTLSTNFTLPANALTTTTGRGRMLRVTAWGTTAANASNKTIRLYFGATVLITDSSGFNNISWLITGTVLQKAGSNQEGIGMFLQGASPNGRITRSAPAESPAGTIVVKLTGQNNVATANDILQTGGMIEILN